jgi:hypothetical protein
MRILRRPRLTWRGYNKMDLKEVGLAEWWRGVGLDSYGTG